MSVEPIHSALNGGPDRLLELRAWVPRTHNKQHDQLLRPPSRLLVPRGWGVVGVGRPVDGHFLRVIARFHEPTKHVDKSTLVGHLEANAKSLVLVKDECRRLMKKVWSSQFTMVNDQSMSQPTILDMSNILLKNTDDQLIRRSL